MGIDYGVMQVQWKPRPGDPIYDFLWTLAEHAECTSSGSVYGCFQRKEVEDIAASYAKAKALTPEGEQAILNWIEALPWDEDYITLTFNW